MGVAQRRSLLAGLALVSVATVMLGVAVTRLGAAVFGVEHAYLTSSFAFLALGAGALVAAALKVGARPGRLLRRLSQLSVVASAFALVSVIAFAYLTLIKSGLAIPAVEGAPADLPSALSWVAMGLVAAMPFFLGGAVMAAAARGAARFASVFCFAYLAGAAVGCLGALLALRDGGPRAVLVVAVVFACAALAFGLGARAPTPSGAEPHAGLGAVATLLLGSAVVLAGDVGAPWLTLALDGRGIAEKNEVRRWSELGLIAVDKVSGGRASVREDRDKIPPILDNRAQPSPEPQDIAYAVRSAEGPVLILDAGGGRDVRAALKAGQKSVVVVVLHPVVAELVLGQYRRSTGALFERDGVELIVGDGRSDLRRLPGTFRSIVLPSAPAIEGSSVSPVGGLKAARARLRTREALADYLDRLADDGTLVLTQPKADFERLLALGGAALRDRGEVEPKTHMFGCGSKDDAALIVKRTAMTAGDVRTLRQNCRKQHFDELFAPDNPGRQDNARIALGADLAALSLQGGVDLTPATDDRPFSNAPGGLAARLGRLGAHGGSDVDRAATAAMVIALGVLLVGLALGLLLTRARPGSAAGSRVWPVRLLLSFAAVGCAIAALESYLVGQVEVVLGHPTYGLTVALPALLIALGLGSLLSGGVRASRAASAALSRGLVGAVVVAAIGLALQRSGALLEVQGWDVRFAVALAACTLVGALLGSQIPLGLRVAETVEPSLVAWCWGLLLAGRAFGAAAGAVVVDLAGYEALLVSTAGLFLLAAVALPPAKARGAGDGGGALRPVGATPTIAG